MPRETLYLRTVQLDQAMMVAEFRTAANYDDVRWAIYQTEFAVGNAERYGYVL